jgi:hypothetical protein
MKRRAGKRSSPLDDIRPESWTPLMSDEFLDLLWVLEATLAMEPELSAALNKVVSGPCFKSNELPTPSASESKPPAPQSPTGDLIALMEGDEASDAGNEDSYDEDE